jgi:hypothetical protein
VLLLFSCFQLWLTMVMPLLYQLLLATCFYVQPASRCATVLLVQGSYIDAVIREPVPCDATT